MKAWKKLEEPTRSYSPEELKAIVIEATNNEDLADKMAAELQMEQLRRIQVRDEL